MKTLTAARAKALREPGKYRAEQTLYLRVRPSGRKSWVQRLTIHGKRRDIGLGPFGLVPLAEARVKAWENRRAVFEGRDPLAERRREKAPTFREAAARTLKGLRSQWRNGKRAAQWATTLETHAFPVIGDQRVDSIRGEDVLRVLLPIWTAKAETARRVRQRIRTVLSWAQAHGFTAGNAAGEGIDGALPKGNVRKTHFRALPLPGGGRGPGDGGRVAGESFGASLLPVPGPDGGALGGGARGAVERDGCGGPRVAHSRRADQDRSAASDSPVRRGHGRPGAGACP